MPRLLGWEPGRAPVALHYNTARLHAPFRQPSDVTECGAPQTRSRFRRVAPSAARPAGKPACGDARAAAGRPGAIAGGAGAGFAATR